ncbi:MAG: hypothetical protein RL394_840 [Bacteroidota bacterium]|jgi:hypothetical protein
MLLSYNVFKQVAKQKDIALHFSSLVASLQGWGFLLLLLVLMIMVVQWLLEARKWQVMLSPGHLIKLSDAFTMILSGIALSIATPNRMGEFAGRVMHLPSGQRLQGTAYTVIGNFAQLIVTCTAGSIALLMEWQGQHFNFTLPGMQAIQSMLLWATPLAIVFFMLLYFKSGLVFNRILSLRILATFRDRLGVLESIPNNILLKVLLLSSFRFVLFILQYWLLFTLTNTGIDLRDTFSAISIMLLWLAIVPTFSFLELGLRWQFALMLMGSLTENNLGIAVSVTAVWLINLMLPALVGALGLLRYRSK